MTLHKNITVHPGELLLRVYIEPSGLTITDVAKKMDVSVAQLSRLTNGKSSMSVEMAKKLEKVFKRTAKGWMISQVNYDLSRGDNHE